jgi:hypothetical protein
MKSPITGKEMTLTKERRSMEFRKETFEIVFHFYNCQDSGEQFTTTELDELNMNQIHNQYRDKFNIPYSDKISNIRKKHQLPGTKMSEVLGFGINTYRQYESGEIPTMANARLIQMVDDPTFFIEMVELCTTIDEESKVKYIQRAQQLALDNAKNNFDLNFKDYLLGNHFPDIYSGYRIPNLEKFTEMVIYFSHKLSPFKTKLNKLLFYADFSMFKQSCFSISGIRYYAIDKGPVPNNFQSIFEYLVNQGEIEICNTEFPNWYVGEQLKPQKNRKFNNALFSESELNIL